MSTSILNVRRSAPLPRMMETSQMQSHRIRLKLRWLVMGLTLATLVPPGAGSQTPASGIQATTAPLALPAGVAFDSAGNLYIADLNDHLIREVNVAGIVTTVAGTGEQGFSGDGGAATNALLDSPTGVAVDAAGNLYISDTHNHRIRKVSGGTITTIAGTGVAGFSGDGGLAVSATLNNPTALAVDANGNLYIADTDNHRIRKVTGTTITTVAGSGEQFFSGDGAPATAAGLDSPNGVTVDSNGSIYIGDTHNQRIRVVSPSGTISTLAGNGSKTYAGDGGAAASASLDRPRGLSVDALGNIYVADSDNHRIRVIATTGTITTLAGSGSQGFTGDGGPAINASLDTPRAPAVTTGGAVALSDTNNNVVREVGANGTINTIAGLNPAIGSGQTNPGEAISLAGASNVTYGSGSLTATFINAGLIATGQVSALDITGGGSTVIGSGTLTANTATVSTAALSAGVHSIVVSYGGDANNPPVTSGVFLVTVDPLPLTASITSVSLQYGQTVPPITGTLTGVLGQDANNVTAVFTTTATSASPTGQYPISVTLVGTAAGNYTVTLASGSRNVVVGKAASKITLTSSNTTPVIGTSVTLTAQVASTTTGTATGSVAFYDGTTLLTMTALSSGGAASYTVNTLAVGSHSITAFYSGDANFTATTSTATLETVGNIPPDFALIATGATSQAVNPGQSAIYNFTVQSISGTFTSAATLTASGLPAGATATFTPATIPLTSSLAPFSLSIQTQGLQAANNRPSSPSRTPLLPASAVLFLLPLLSSKRLRAGFDRMPRTLLGAIFLLLSGVAVLGMTGCGTGGFFPQAPQSYTVTVTATTSAATGTTLQHTSLVTLIVQ